MNEYQMRSLGITNYVNNNEVINIVSTVKGASNKAIVAAYARALSNYNVSMDGDKYNKDMSLVMDLLSGRAMGSEVV